MKGKSTKSSRALGVRGSAVKSEPLYRSLFSSCIINSAPPHVKIYPEILLRAENGEQLKVDIVLEGDDNKCAIELVAHVEPSVVKAHIDKTVKYKKLLNANQAFVIHFTTAPDEKMGIYKNLVNDEVTVLHVQHSLTFDTIKLYKNLDPIIIKRTGDQ